MILSHTFYESNPEEFFRFYRAKLLAPDAKPNAAHYKLAQWEREGKLKAIITQNIDGLHQAAGSKNVLELHGSVHRNYCEHCGKFYDFDFMLHSEGVPRCTCGGTVKPDVVLYEEGLNQKTLNDAVRFISEADMLIIGGTSLNVYPAAGLINYYRGHKLVLINKSAVARDLAADLVITGPHRPNAGPVVKVGLCEICQSHTAKRRHSVGDGAVFAKVFVKNARHFFIDAKFLKIFLVYTDFSIENESDSC